MEFIIKNLFGRKFGKKKNMNNYYEDPYSRLLWEESFLDKKNEF
jgi:hypothetical protein